MSATLLLIAKNVSCETFPSESEFTESYMVRRGGGKSERTASTLDLAADTFVSARNDGKNPIEKSLMRV